MKLDTLELGSESLAYIVLCGSILPPYMYDLLSILGKGFPLLYEYPKTVIVSGFQPTGDICPVVTSHINQRKKIHLLASWKYSVTRSPSLVNTHLRSASTTFHPASIAESMILLTWSLRIARMMISVSSIEAGGYLVWNRYHWSIPRSFHTSI